MHVLFRKSISSFVDGGVWTYFWSLRRLVYLIGCRPSATGDRARDFGCVYSKCFFSFKRQVTGNSVIAEHAYSPRWYLEIYHIDIILTIIPLFESKIRISLPSIVNTKHWKNTVNHVLPASWFFFSVFRAYTCRSLCHLWTMQLAAHCSIRGSR